MKLLILIATAACSFVIGATAVSDPDRVGFVPDPILSLIAGDPDRSLPDGQVVIDVTNPEPPAWIDPNGPVHETTMPLREGGVLLRGVPKVAPDEPVPHVDRVVVTSFEVPAVRAYWPATPGTVSGDEAVKEVFAYFGRSPRSWLEQPEGSRDKTMAPLTAGWHGIFVNLHLAADGSGEDHYVEILWTDFPTLGE